jgi:hypothetical protein
MFKTDMVDLTKKKQKEARPVYSGNSRLFMGYFLQLMTQGNCRTEYSLIFSAELDVHFKGSSTTYAL